MPTGVRANPQGEDLRAGEATFHRAGPALTVDQQSDLAIINWQSFSIDPNESTSFVQPSTNAAALNRVTTGNPSALLGTLESNGRLFLINPNGVLVGEGSRIDTGSFTASTLDVDDAEFLAQGDLHLRGDSQAGVEVRGAITAHDGDVVLIGRRVENSGALRAPNGEALLGAGTEVLLKEHGEERILVAPGPAPSSSSAPDAGASAALANSGSIEAVRVRLEAAGGNPYALAIRNDGAVRATGAVAKDGRVVLTGRGGDVANAGTIVARNADGSGGSVRMDGGADGTVWHSGSVDVAGTGNGNGGDARVYGDRVALLGGSSIDASGGGTGDGGRVLVGGDARNLGGEAAQPIAAALHVAKTATVRARGGNAGGDGGFVETSGKQLEIQNAPDAGAGAGGTAGEWLIDPFDLTVVAGAGTTGVSGSTPFTSNADDGQLGVDLIAAGLASSNVTVESGGGGAQAGRIIWNAPLDYDLAGTGRTLTVNAHDDIAIEAAIGQSGIQNDSLNIVLNADSDGDGAGAISIDAPISTGGGDLSILDGAFVRANLATSTDQAGRAGGDLSFATAVLIASGSGITFSTTGPAGAGNVTFAGTVDSGNAYAFVNDTTRTWTDAFTDAIGVTGGGAAVGDTYLATITSNIENAIVSSAAGHTQIWIGATDTAVEGTWRWVAGPEGTEAGGQGRAFWSGVADGSPVGGQYTNWNTGEPNNAGEDYGQGGFGPEGRWNDLPNSPLLEYVRETNLAPTALTIDAGTTGVVTFSADVGSDKPLASLAVTAQSLSTASSADITTTGGFANPNVTLTTLRGNLTSTGGGVTIARPTEVSGSVILSALGTEANVSINDDVTHPGASVDSLTVRANGNVEIGTNATIDASAGVLDVTLNSDRDESGAGGVALASGSGIDTNGGDLVIGGGSNPLAESAVGTATTSGRGIDIIGSTIETGAGDIVMNGRGWSAASGGVGVDIGGTSTVRSGTGSITLGGVGGAGPIDLGIGVRIFEGSLVETTGGGALTINGTASASGAFAMGVNVDDSIVRTSGAGTIAVTGIGSAVGSSSGNHGVFLSGAGEIVGTGPLITVQGTAGAGSSGIALGDGVNRIGQGATGTFAGSIFLTADTMALTFGGTASQLQSTGPLTLRPLTASTSIGLGSGAGTLSFDSAEVALLQDGFSLITIGHSAGTGAITTAGAVTFLDPLELRSPTAVSGGISIGGVLTAPRLTLRTPGATTQSAAVVTPLLELIGGAFLLADPGNAVGTLAANATSVTFRDDSGFLIGTAGATSGLTTSGDSILISAGPVTQSQAITAPGLALLGAGGAYTLANTTNAITTLAGNTGSIDFRDNSGFAIGTVGANSGVTTSGNTTLRSTGAITQTQAITAAGLEAVGGTLVLDTANNAVTTLAASGSSLRFLDNSGFAVGTVGATSGITTSGNTTLISTGPVTQTQAISAPGLEIAGAGAFDLDDVNNAVTTLAGSTASLTFRDDTGFAIGTVNAANGITTTGDTSLTSIGGTVTQSQAIAAAGLSLLGSGATYDLTSASNAITTLAGNTGAVHFRENSGFAIGTVGATIGLTSSAIITLRSTGAVTQTAGVTATGLELIGGSFDLDDANNAVTTLAMSGSALAFRDDTGFDIGTFGVTNGITTTGDTVLTSSGAVTQSQAIAASGLAFLGAGGAYSLNHGGNGITTLAGNTGSVHLREDGGFAIGTVGSTVGLTTTGTSSLNSGGAVTQLQAITAPDLRVIGGGSFDLDDANNAVTTLAASASSLAFRDDTGFSIGNVSGTNGTTTSGDTVLTSAGAVTQSAPIVAAGLELDGGGSFTLTNAGNDISTIAGAALSLSFRDDTGFLIGTVGGQSGVATTADTTFTTSGTVNQVQQIGAAGLALLGTGGTYNLSSGSNVISTLAGNTGAVNFAASGGYAIGSVGATTGLTTTGNTTLSTPGAVTQSQAISAAGLELRGTGSYTLGNAGNAITTLAGSSASIDFRENSGFAIGSVGTSVGLTTTGSLALRSTGSVTQTQVVTAPSLQLVGGSFDLDDVSNVVATLAASGSVLAFRDDTGFAIGTAGTTSGITTSSNTTLTSIGGTITQSQAITASGLSLLGAGSVWTLGHTGNAITTLAANGGTLDFRENSGFDIGTIGATVGITTSANTSLRSTGTVTQTQKITAPGLLVVNGAFDLDDVDNAVTTIAADAASLAFRDDTGFDVGTVGTSGITTTGNTVLTSNGGTVTQSQAIAASGLALLGTNGRYDLTDAGNAITTLAGNTEWIDFRDDSGFGIGVVGATTGVTTGAETILHSTGSVTQTDAIQAGGLALDIDGTATFMVAGNDVETFAADVGSLAFRDDDGFDIGTVGGFTGITATGDVTLQSTGTVGQTQAIAAAGLELIGGSSATFDLASLNNAVTTLAASSGSLSFLDDTGFAVGTVGSTSGIATSGNTALISAGSVTQTQPIAAAGLELAGIGGAFVLENTGNAISTLAGNTGSVAFRENSGFAIGTVNTTNGLTASGNITLRTTGAVTQTRAVTTPTLQLVGGSFDLDDVNNAVTRLAGSGSTLTFRDDTGFEVGVAGASAGIATTGNTALTSIGGTVTQSQPLSATGLSLLGAGGTFLLADISNGISTLAGNTGAVDFRDDSGFSIGSVLGTVGLATSGNSILHSAGPVTQTQRIAADGLSLLGGGGTYLLTNAGNTITTLASNTNSIDFREDSGFAIGTVGPTVGVTTLGNVALLTSGTVTQSQPIVAQGLAMRGAGATYDLMNVSNAITNLAANTGTVRFREDSGFAIGIVAGTIAFTATGNTTLRSAGDVTQTHAITTPGLELLGGTVGDFKLDTVDNSIGTLAAEIAFLRLRDDNGFSIGTVNATNGVTTIGDTTFTTGGSVTQTQPLIADGLVLLGAGGNYTLTNADNAWNTLVVDTGSVDLRANSGFDIGTVESQSGVTATGDVVLRSTGTVTQSAAILADGLGLEISTDVVLLHAGNDVNTLAADVLSLSLRDDDGYVIGTVDGITGLSALGDLRLETTGTLTQAEAIFAEGLELVGGSFDLDGFDNDITTLAMSGGGLTFRDDDGFDIGAVGATSGISATGDVVLTSSGPVTQSEAIGALGLSLLGSGGAYSLANSGNAITTLAGNTGSVDFRENSGFAIGTVAGTVGLTATGDVTLRSNGVVTESQAIGATGLELVGGSFDLDGVNNAVTTVAMSGSDLTFRDDTGFDIGTVGATTGITTTGDTVLTSSAAVTQSQAISAGGLALLGAGGSYSLNHGGNGVTRLAGDTGSILFRDDSGFAIGLVGSTTGLSTTGTTTLNSSGTVTQTQAITAPGLALIGGGSFDLDDAANAVTTIAANGTSLAFRDDTGFDIGTVGSTSGVTTTGDTVLTSTGAVTQSQAISAAGLALLGEEGSYSLNQVGNGITTLAGNTGSISIREDGGFSVGTVGATVGVTTSGTTALSSSGAVTQTQAITAPDLALIGGGSFDLDDAANAVTTIAANGASLAFRDDTGFDVGIIGSTSGITTTGDTVLTTTGPVTQTESIAAAGLSLLGTGGVYTLTDADNAITTLAGNTGIVDFRDDSGFAIGTVGATTGLTTTGATTLRSTGTVTQTQSLVAPSLALIGGIFDLDDVNNAVTALAMSGDALAFRDDTGFAIGAVGATSGITTTGDTVLTTGDTVTQTEAIDAAGLSLLGAGGVYTLTDADNAITTLAGNTGNVDFRDDSGFAIGTVGATAGLTTSVRTTLRSAGAVTQGQSIASPSLALVGGSFDLDGANNAVTTLAMSGTALAFRDDTGFSIGTVGATSGITTTGDTVLTSEGAVTQSDAISAAGLALLGSAGTYTLGHPGNAITTLAGNTGSVLFRENSGFAIGIVDGVATGLTTAGTTSLHSTGTVTQTEVITAPDLELVGGTFVLDANNHVTTVAMSGDALTFFDIDGFDVGAIGSTTGITTTGDTALITGGTVTQSQAIDAAGLALLGADGTYVLTHTGNAITTLAGDTGAVDFVGDSGFAIGTVGTTEGLITTGTTTLRSAGSVTQSDAILAQDLELVGGSFELSHPGNDVGTLAMSGDLLSFAGLGGFDVGTVGGTSGITTTGNTALFTNGVVTQSEAIDAAGLLLAGTGAFTLNHAGNAITTLAAEAGSIAVRDDSGFDVGAVAVPGFTALGITTTEDTVLTTGSTVTQTEAIDAAGLSLLGAGGVYTLAHADNAIATLAGNAGTVDFRDDAGFAIGTVGATTGLTTSVRATLRSAGAVTQTQSLVAPSLALVGGTFDLDDANNAVTTIAMSGDALAFRDDAGFSIGTVNGTSGIATTGDTVLTSGGAVTQTDAIGAAGLALLGAGGTYTLDHPANAITTLAGDTGSVDFRESSGFAIGTVGATTGLTTAGTTTLRTTGTVTQSESITAPSLALVGGTFDLDGASNAVTTLAMSGAALGFRDDTGFVIGTVGATDGITTTGDAGLTSSGIVTQSEAIDAAGLSLLGAGGAYVLTHTGNAIATLAGNTGAVDFVDDSGFAIGTVGATTGLTTTGTTTLHSTGTVTQSEAIAAASLELVGGTFELGDASNAVTTLAMSGDALAFRGDTGFAIGTVGGTSGITTTGDTTLTSGGAVTQAARIESAGLTLLGTGGAYTLAHADNVITALAADTGSLVLRDDSGIAVGTIGGTAGVTTTGDTSLLSATTVTQTEAIVADGLELAGGAGAVFPLGTIDNDVARLAVDGASLDFRDDTGFTVGTVGDTTGITISGDTTLRSDGTVAGTQPITATGLTLLGAGDFALDGANNDVALFAANVGSLSFRDDDGFFIGTIGATNGITAVGEVTLVSNDVVLAVQPVVATGLELLGGVFDLDNVDNEIDRLAADVGELDIRDDDGFVIGTVRDTSGVTAMGDVKLGTLGPVTQTAAVVAAGLELAGGTAGTFVLDHGYNDVTTLAAQAESLRFRDDSGFDISIDGVTSGITTTGTTRLRSAGIVTQSQAIDAGSLLLLGAGGTYTLAHAGNAITTLAADTGSLELRENSGFAIGQVGAVHGMTLEGDATLHSAGVVTQSEAIEAAGLALRGPGGTFILTNAANDVDELAANGATTLSFRDDTGFSVGTVGGTAGITLGTDVLLRSAGAVTQTQPIQSDNLTLVGDTTGTFDLDDADNDVDRLVAGTGSLRFRDDTGLTSAIAVGSGGASTSTTPESSSVVLPIPVRAPIVAGPEESPDAKPSPAADSRPHFEPEKTCGPEAWARELCPPISRRGEGNDERAESIPLPAAVEFHPLARPDLESRARIAFRDPGAGSRTHWAEGAEAPY